MSIKTNLPQHNINVQVEFYDEEQKEKLLEYPSNKQIQGVVENDIEIPIEEFLTYYLFYRKRPGKEGYRNYQELGRKIDRALTDLEDWIDFNGHSIVMPKDVGYQDVHITERIGESIGLAVVNRIHGLSEADWDRIPEMRGRTAPPSFDYQIASDGTSIIQVETKGSSANNNETKTDAVYAHKSNIVKKKHNIAKLESTNSYKYPANLRYGTISVVDTKPDGLVRCWLLDPDPEPIEIAAVKLRLINRMRFLRDWIYFISPRSQLVSALSTRLADLEALSDPFELDNVPLLRGDGEPFELVPTPDDHHNTIGFLLNKSRTTDEASSGVVVQLSDGNFLFIGFRDEIVINASKQNFESIVSYKAQTGILNKIVNCVFHKNHFKELKLPDTIIERAEEIDNHFTIHLNGELFHNQDGLVFGILPLEGK